MRRLLAMLLLLPISALAAKSPPQQPKMRVYFFGVHFITTNSLWSQSEIARTRRADTNFAHVYAQRQILGTNDGNLLRTDWLVVNRFTRKVIPRSKVAPAPALPRPPPTLQKLSMNPIVNDINAPGAKAKSLPILPAEYQMHLEWHYTNGVVWDVISTENFIDWTVVASGLSTNTLQLATNASGMNVVTWAFTNTGPMRFFRVGASWKP